MNTGMLQFTPKTGYHAMKKFNLFKEIIIVERAELLRAASSQKNSRSPHG